MLDINEMKQAAGSAGSIQEAVGVTVRGVADHIRHTGMDPIKLRELEDLLRAWSYQLLPTPTEAPAEG